MPLQTKCEEIAAECITRFNLQPIPDIYTNELEVAWMAYERHLDDLMTQELALDIILNFPDKYINRLCLEVNDALGQVHPRIQLLELAKCCVRHIVYEQVHGRSRS